MKRKMNEVKINSSEILAGIKFPDDECIITSHQVGDHLQAVTFDLVREQTLKDEKNMKLAQYIHSSWFSRY